MSKTTGLMVALLLLCAPLFSAGQVQNEGYANLILAARAANTTMMKQYNWSSRVELLEKGVVQDIRVELVTTGPDGKTSRSLLNDTPGALPNGFIRKAIAEGNRKKLEQQLQGVRAIAEQYTLPSAGKVIDFLAGAQVTVAKTPDGKSILQVNGTSVVVPGDTFALTVDGVSYKPTRLRVSTTYEGDPILLTVTFMTLQSGLNVPQYSTLEIPSKQVTVNLHNFDFVSNN